MVALISTSPSEPTQQRDGKAITFYNPDMATLLLLAGFWGLPAMLHRSSKEGVGDEREDEHEMSLYMSRGSWHHVHDHKRHDTRLLSSKIPPDHWLYHTFTH